MTVFVFSIGSTVVGAYSTLALAEMERRRIGAGHIDRITIDRPA